MKLLPMKAASIALWLSLHPAAYAASVDGVDDPAGQVRSAIHRDWGARVDDSGAVTMISPVYAMPFGQGCVIHRLHFRSHGGRPSLGDMIAENLYFVFASGDACAAVDPARFFGIEPHNDVFGLLDFARRLKEGPKPGRDGLSDAAFARLSRCFTPEAMRSTQVVRAHSWQEEGSLRYRYQVTLSCGAPGDGGDVIAIGVRGQDAIAWTWGALEQTTHDLPASARP